MRKIIAVSIAVMTVGLWFAPRLLRGQDRSAEISGEKIVPGQDAAAAKVAKPKALEAYRLDFSFNEIEDDKKINTRHYSLNLTSESQDEVKIGTRVPVAAGTSGPDNATTQYQYMDVGTRISAQLRSRGDDEQLIVNSEISNLDLPLHAREGALTVQQAPVVRQIRIDGDTLLVLGKPIMIGSVDDPNSKRQFQLEVTVTKLR